MIEILMLLGAIGIWFVLSMISSYVAFYKLREQFGKAKYKIINNTGRKKSRKKAVVVLLTMGPFVGFFIYHQIRVMIEMHQGKIYLEEV